MHYFYREMDFRETEKPTLTETLFYSLAFRLKKKCLTNELSVTSALCLDVSERPPAG